MSIDGSVWSRIFRSLDFASAANLAATCRTARQHWIQSCIHDVLPFMAALWRGVALIRGAELVAARGERKLAELAMPPCPRNYDDCACVRAALEYGLAANADACRVLSGIGIFPQFDERPFRLHRALFSDNDGFMERANAHFDAGNDDASWLCALSAQKAFVAPPLNVALEHLAIGANAPPCTWPCALIELSFAQFGLCRELFEPDIARAYYGNKDFPPQERLRAVVRSVVERSRELAAFIVFSACAATLFGYRQVTTTTPSFMNACPARSSLERLRTFAGGTGAILGHHERALANEIIFRVLVPAAVLASGGGGDGHIREFRLYLAASKVFRQRSSDWNQSRICGARHEGIERIFDVSHLRPAYTIMHVQHSATFCVGLYDVAIQRIAPHTIQLYIGNERSARRRWQLHHPHVRGHTAPAASIPGETLRLTFIGSLEIRNENLYFVHWNHNALTLRDDEMAPRLPTPRCRMLALFDELSRHTDEYLASCVYPEAKCSRCKRSLTGAKSIAAGMGSVCKHVTV